MAYQTYSSDRSVLGNKPETVEPTSTIKETTGKKLSGTEKETFLKEMRENYDRARQREHENILEAYLDLGFRGGDAQWDATALNERQAERRPCMIINMIPQFVRQVTGDIRQMKPGIKVIGVDDRADQTIADV